jgi:DNA replication protein DnaC
MDHYPEPAQLMLAPRQPPWSRVPVPGTCDVHGSYDGGVQPRYRGYPTCPTCAAEADEAAERARVEQLAEEKWQASLDAANLRGRFRSTTLANFTAATPAQQAALDTCRAFAAEADVNSGEGLFLIGPPGVGKTHLAAGIVHALRHRRYIAMLYTAREIVRRLRATWARSATESEAVVIELLGHCALLAIDEVGVGFGSEAEQVQLLDIIDLRYQLKRPTVVASNLNLTGIRGALGERAFDRLREGAKVVPMNWASHRGTSA